MEDKKKKELEKLQEELDKKKSKLFHLKMEHSIKKLKDTSKIKKVRKEIARILTKINTIGNKSETRLVLDRPPSASPQRGRGMETRSGNPKPEIPTKSSSD